MTALFKFCHQWAFPSVRLHQWINEIQNIEEVWCLFSHFLCFKELPPSCKLSDFHLQILRENILWEYCTLPMQIESYKNPLVIEHLKRLRSSLNSLEHRSIKETFPIIEWAISQLCNK